MSIPETPKPSTPFSYLKQAVNDAERHANDFYEKGVKVAGTRLRTAMQEVKKLSQQVREDVTAKKNA